MNFLLSHSVKKNYCFFKLGSNNWSIFQNYSHIANVSSMDLKERFHKRLYKVFHGRLSSFTQFIRGEYSKWITALKEPIHSTILLQYRFLSSVLKMYQKLMLSTKQMLKYDLLQSLTEFLSMHVSRPSNFRRDEIHFTFVKVIYTD